MKKSFNVDGKIIAKLKGSVSIDELVREDPENAEEIINEYTIEGSGRTDSKDNRANVQSPQV